MAKAKKELSISLWQRIFENEALLRYCKAITYGIAALMLFLLLAYRFAASSRSNSEKDYLNAETEFSKFSSSLEEESQTAFKSLQAILNRHAELHPKYDGRIVQTLVKQGKTQPAQDYAQIALQRFEEPFSSLYGNFSQNTLFIAEGKYEKALEEAKKLKQALLQHAAFSFGSSGNGAFGELLFAYNLLRIAILEQESGSVIEENTVWKELLERSGWSGESSPRPVFGEKAAYAYQEMLANFRENGVSLLDYIEERQKAIPPGL